MLLDNNRKECALSGKIGHGNDNGSGLSSPEEATGSSRRELAAAVAAAVAGA